MEPGSTETITVTAYVFNLFTPEPHTVVRGMGTTAISGGQFRMRHAGKKTILFPVDFHPNTACLVDNTYKTTSG